MRHSTVSTCGTEEKLCKTLMVIGAFDFIEGNHSTRGYIAKIKLNKNRKYFFV